MAIKAYNCSIYISLHSVDMKGKGLVGVLPQNQASVANIALDGLHTGYR